MQRCIDPYIIHVCIENGTIYESETNRRPDVVFAGHDEQGVPRYAALRGCTGDFKGEVAGSNKRFAFKLTSREENEEAHVFESAIDALSYATILRDADMDWQRENLLSLGGVPPVIPGQDKQGLPRAIAQYLTDNPGTRKASLHLDNDNAGKHAAETIASALSLRGIEVSISPPKTGKDMNDWLLATKGVEAPKHTEPKTKRPSSKGHSR